MKTLEDELFYACTNYCDALNHYKTAREQLMVCFEHNRTEKEILLDFEKGKVENAFERLKNTMEKINV